MRKACHENSFNGIRVKIYINLFFLWLVSWGSAMPAYSYLVPLKLLNFSTSGFGAANPVDIVFNTSSKNYAVLDDATDKVYIADSAGKLISDFSIGASGCNSPRGIAYNPVSKQYAVTDYYDREVYIFKSDGTYQNHWDTASFGSLNPTGITYNPDTDQYVICDAASDMVYFVNTNGSLVTNCGISDIGCNSPEGISYNSISKTYAIIDNDDDEVYIVNNSCPLTLQENFDTQNGLDSSIAFGITWVSKNEIAIVDYSKRQVYVADISGSILDSQDISAWGCIDSTGIAFISTTQQVAITDSVDDAIYIFDINGDFDRTMLTSSFGSTRPAGIAFNNRSNRFAIVDSLSDQVYIIDTSGNLKYSFSVSIHGCTNPSGINYNYETNEYMITDKVNHMVIFTDTNGKLLRQMATGVSGGTAPVSTAYLMSSGNYMIPDYNADEIYIVNSKGISEMSFDTYNFASPSYLSGIDYDRKDGYIFLADAATDAFYILDMPRVLPATTPSGTYSGTLAGQYCTLKLRMASPEEFCDGFLISAGVTYKTPGYLNIGTGKITLSLISPSGFSTYEGTVSSDFKTIVFPSPLGTLKRVLKRSL